MKDVRDSMTSVSFLDLEVDDPRQSWWLCRYGNGVARGRCVCLFRFRRAGRSRSFCFGEVCTRLRSGFLTLRITYFWQGQLSTIEEDSRSRNWIIGCGYPYVGVRLFGHEFRTFPHSFSSEGDLRESRSNVPEPHPGMERSLFVTGGSPESCFTLRKILEA